MKQKSIKNIRKEFKDNGIFYTPEKLAEKIKSYVDFEPETVYDPTCGVGNLLKVFRENVKKYGQELDEEQLALIDIPNYGLRICPSYARLEAMIRGSEED